MTGGTPPLPRPPRPLIVHAVVDSAVVFLATIVAAWLFGAPWWIVLTVSVAVGVLAAPWTRRAEIRALAEGLPDPGQGEPLG